MISFLSHLQTPPPFQLISLEKLLLRLKWTHWQSFGVALFHQLELILEEHSKMLPSLQRHYHQHLACHLEVGESLHMNKSQLVISIKLERLLKTATANLPQYWYWCIFAIGLGTLYPVWFLRSTILGCHR